MEFIHGVKINDLEGLKRNNIDPEEVRALPLSSANCSHINLLGVCDGD